MRRSVVLSVLTVCVAAAVAGACGSSRPDFVDPDGGDSVDLSPTFGPSDGGGKPACVNLGCKQVACAGGGTTSVSGVVWDPAGKNPVYNAVVYVPNAPVDTIKHGPVCDSCGGAPVSGNPLVTTLTDPTGAFKLQNVPVGTDIPVVIQVGKWRRQLVIPATAECADTALPAAQTRLPKNQSEGDMPLIALTSGCDPIHSLVEKIGVDHAEFTDGKGKGAVHVYAGKGGNGTGVSSATDAYAFWGTLSEMMRYDIIINECECSPYPRDTAGPAYENMRAYLDSGGRVFNSHYHLNFFGNSSENGNKAAPELVNAAKWSLWGGAGGGGAPFKIDTTFPKGQAMDDWLNNLPAVSKWGKSIKTTPKGQIQTTSVGDIGGTVPGLSQRWIYPSTGSSAVYVSINTPTSAPAADRCGRAVATDLHVANSSMTSMTEQEAALEFMFFDLASCVIDDGVPPAAPQPH
jgi:hypothetical protein